jgi:hypothetical protein
MSIFFCSGQRSYLSAFVDDGLDVDGSANDERVRLLPGLVVLLPVVPLPGVNVNFEMFLPKLKTHPPITKAIIFFHTLFAHVATLNWVLFRCFLKHFLPPKLALLIEIIDICTEMWP